MNHRPSGYEPDELPTAPPRDKTLVDRGGFEPPKRNAADLQSAPFSHSGTCPLKTRHIIQHHNIIVKAFFLTPDAIFFVLY